MIKLRQATLNDLAVIIHLDQDIFGAYGADEEPGIIRSRLEVFPEGCVVLIETQENDSILGYLTTEKWASLREPMLDENPYETPNPLGTVLNITTLAIAPTYQNRQLGKRLLDYAVEIARRENCIQIVLETARAQRFYLRHNFTIISERQQRGIHLTVMGLDVAT